MKMYNKTQRIVLVLFGFILAITSSFSQTVGVDPSVFPDCNQNNVIVSNVAFRDVNGNPIDPTGDLDIPIGTPLQGGLFITFGGNTNNAFSFYTQFDVLINEQAFVGNRVIGCVSVGQQVVIGREYFIGNFTWNYGDKLEVRNILVAWRTNANASCGPPNSNAQCFTEKDGLTALTPLVANFDFEDNCEDLKVNFSDLSTGGNVNSPYTYVWSVDLNNNGSFTQFSTAKNPTFEFLQAGTFDGHF